MIQTVPIRCPNCSGTDRVERSALKFGFEFQCKYCSTTSVLAVNNQLIIPSAGERVCVKCGTVSPSTADGCTSCGAALMRACVNPDCRRMFPIYHEVCDHCGYPQRVDPNSPSGITVRGQLALREMGSKNPQLRRRGAQKLARLGSRAAFAVPYLVPLVKRDPLNACLVLAQLGEAGAPAVSPLIDLLQFVDQDTSVQSAACKALAGIGAPAKDALPPLVQLIAKTGSAPIVTYTGLIADAFNAITRISALTGVKTTTPTLKALITVLETAKDDAVLRDACAVLETLGAKAQPAAAALADVFRCHSGARWSAWATLEAMGKTSARLLVEALCERSDDPEAICERLAAMGDSAGSAVQELIDIIDDPLQPELTRQSAYIALARIGAPAVPPLFDLLKKTPDTHTINNVSYTLAAMGKSALQPLIRGLKSENSEVQYVACVALGRMGTDAQEALPALKSILGLTGMLSLKSSKVKEAAKVAIKQIQQTA